MKDRLNDAKRWYNRNADLIAYGVYGAAISVAGVLIGFDLGKRKTAKDLRVIGARDFVNNETGEISELYMYHRNGTVSVLGARLNK